MKLALMIVCSAVLLGACGSSTPSGPQAKFGAALKFSQCMRAHGLTNFPDPSSSGGGIQIPAGANPGSPSFQTAQKACAKYLPGGPFLGHASAGQKQRMLRMSECMRAHGLKSFPDPVSTPPQPGAGLGIAFGSPGAFIAIPQSMINSPGFNQAASACGLPGAGRFPGGKPQGAVTKP